jgi:serine/threonine-protein kinase
MMEKCLQPEPRATQSPSQGPAKSLPALLSGRYLPITELGEGGISNVYLAADVRNDRKVALKVVKAGLKEQEKARGMLEAEAKALAIIGHPGVPKLIDSSFESSQPFIVIEYFENSPLPKHAFRGRMKEFLKACMDLCDILTAVHSAGIVHRDIKPANILFGRSFPDLRLIDFSHSKVPGMEDYSRSSSTPFGTPAFMAPECSYAGMNADSRADIYSFGAVMYTYLAGRTPFRVSGTAETMIMQHRFVRSMPLHLIDPSIPKQLSQVVEIALNKFPEDRFPSAAEMKVYLEVLSKAIRL